MLDDQAQLAARHLAAIVESSDDAIVSKTLEGIIRTWNRAAERMFGYTAAEAVGRSIRIIIPADRQSEEDEVLRRIRRGESVDHFETIRVRKDGSQFPVSLTISPVRDVHGNLIGASKIARDITERKLAEQALARAEAQQADLQQRLVALVAASGSLLGSPRIEDVLPAIVRLAAEVVAADAHVVWRLDPARQVWSIVSHSGVSDEFASAAVTVQEAANGSAPAFEEPLAAENLDAEPRLQTRRDAYRREGIRSLLGIPLGSGRGAASLVFYYRSPHTFTSVEVESARALANIAGGALRAADLYMEQHHREHQALFLARAASALASSLNYRETLKSVAQLAVPHIADWCSVDMVNHGVVERLALAHADPLRREVVKEFGEKYPAQLDDGSGVGEVLQTGSPLFVQQLTDEMIADSARSAEHLAALRALGITSFMTVPLRTRQGTIGALTFVSAESKRRYTDADLRFAETVADRAAVAIETATAYEEARTANQLKDEFLATLSHELRTPLNAMLGYTRMLKAAAVPEDRRASALEVIERNGKLLAQIVDEVLDVSRIISGKLRLKIQRMEPSRLLADALAIAAPAAAAKDITLHSDVDKDVGWLHGDPDRLQQVLWNLLTNAVKFTPSGGRIDVRIAAVGTDVEIVVSDTGRGIDPAFLPHIFERFRQADSRITREHGGLGLGLSIARHIVEMHGGTIQGESEGEGRGATFRVRLPAQASRQLLSRLG